MKKIILILLASGLVTNATITITAGAVTNLADENGNELSSNTTFAILVELSGAGDPFDGLVMSDTISIDQTVGDGKYFVLQVGTATDQGGSLNVSGQGAVSNFDLAGTPLAGNAAAGHNVAFVWFPGLVGNVLSRNDVYGVAAIYDGGVAGEEWFLPSDNNAETFQNLTASAAQFTVVPEPTSIALLGLGAFGFIMRRSRG